MRPARPQRAARRCRDAQRRPARRGCSVWGFEIYDASLWVAPGFRADGWARSPLALELRYLRDFERRATSRSARSTRCAAPARSRRRRPNAGCTHMQAVFPDVRERRPRCSASTSPDSGARFFLNGAPTGQMRDADFAAALLRASGSDRADLRAGAARSAAGAVAALRNPTMDSAPRSFGPRDGLRYGLLGTAAGVRGAAALRAAAQPLRAQLRRAAGHARCCCCSARVWPTR